MKSLSSTVRGLLRRWPALESAARSGKRKLWRTGHAAVRRVLATLPVSFAERRLVWDVRAHRECVRPHSIELVVRLSTALRAMPDPDGGNRWLHHRWQGIFEEVFGHVAGLIDVERGFDSLCLGAGTRNPLAFPMLMFLGGARTVAVVEPEPVPAEDDWRVAWGLQEMVLRVMTGSVQSKYFVRPVTDLEGFVDLHRLFFGRDLRRALNPDRVRLFDDFFEDCAIPAGTIDLLTSRSVLEHVEVTERCFDKLADVMRPGGVMCHRIDFTAHSAGDPFAFYYEEPEAGRQRRADGLNGLRRSDYLREFRRRGFDSHVVDSAFATGYRLDRGRLRPRYRDYGEEDLLCTRAVIVSRRPPL